jgi:hypothetical protein
MAAKKISRAQRGVKLMKNPPGFCDLILYTLIKPVNLEKLPKLGVPSRRQCPVVLEKNSRLLKLLELL